MSKIRKENFYDRLKVLGGAAPKKSNLLEHSTLINYTRTNDGAALAIIKENHSYFIKTSISQTDKLGASDFQYIGGVENKFKYQYNSLSEAEKNRNFYILTLNEASSKKFKVGGKGLIKENETIDKAQTHADKLDAEKAQGEADKNMKENGKDLSDSATTVDDTKESSAKPIVVDKEQADSKIVDDTKESSAKPIVIDKKQAPAKVVKENENKPFPPTAEEPAAAPSVDAAAATELPAPSADAAGAEAGEVDASLDAAADALAGMGAGEEAGADAAVDAGAEAPLGGEIDAAGEAPAADGGEPSDADGSIRDIQKLTGKVTEKIRSTVLTPEASKGFLKSFITAFDDKISDLDHEDRKELSQLIMNDKPDTEGFDEPASVEDEKDIEEAINAHLSSMGIGADNMEGNATGSDTKPFKSYVADKGYDPEKVEEISLMEMVSLVNGYTNECGEDDFDGEGVSDYVNSEVNEKLAESGNEIFEALMKPFGEKIKKNKKAYATEAVAPSINEEFGAEEEEEETSTDDSSTETPETTDSAIEIVGADDEKEESPFAPAGETIAIGTPTSGPAATTSGSGSKSVTVDLNNNTVNMTLSESEVKMHKIIRKKIEEALSGKKPSINEGKKSALSIMIDQLIGEAIERRREAIAKRLERR